MGCLLSKTTSMGPLRPIKPWKMDFSEYDKQLNEIDLDDLRTQFWYDRVDNNLDIWQVLKQCCEAFLQGEYEKANAMFLEARLEAPNHDLSECIDKEGQVYRIEKYCYSTPSNLMVGVVEEETSVEVGKSVTYQFRVQSTQTEQVIQLVFDFDPGTLVSTVVIAIKEKLKEQYNMEDIQSIKLIYRGFVLDETQSLFHYSINPEYVVMVTIL